jgi:sarcosine oxidase delta subunit
MTSRWLDRLPAGVEVHGQDRNGFTFGVAMPLGEDGTWLCQCLDAADHRFKLFLDPQTIDLDRPVHCPYCGRQGELSDFFTDDQHARITKAVEVVSEQYVHHTVDRMLRNAFGGLSRSSSQRGGFGIEVSVSPARHPLRRHLPALASEPTRAVMTCIQCSEQAAIYGLALYCPGCGQMAPVQQFTHQLTAHRERLKVIDQLLDHQARALRETGYLTVTHESTIKDGFTALETYLKARFTQGAQAMSLPSGNVFQRLDQANGLFVQHLGIDLATLVGPDHWQTLKTGADLRHVLTHNSGMIDQKFLDKQPGWPQALGQRVIINRVRVERFLTALTATGDILQ